MNHKFIKHHNKIRESLELDFEEKWTYIHYIKGSKEKTACILKNDEKPLQEYLEEFSKENQVSEDMMKDVRKCLNNEKKKNEAHPQTIGDFFKAIKGYFKLAPENGSIVNQNGTDDHRVNEKPHNYRIIDVTLDQVRKAIRTFSDSLPKGVYRSIIVKDDNEIDFTQLENILGGVPSKKFYMSKETYDLFTEDEKLIPFEMDMVQRAVDQYVREHKKFPILDFDPERRINYYQLIQEHFLKTKPEIQFYLTDLDGLITHIKPDIKGMG